MKTDNIRYLQTEVAPKRERLITLDAFYTMFLHQHKKDFYFSGELHDPWELVYVRAGRAGITADARVYHLGAGSLIFHKPLEFHQIWAESDDLQVFISSFSLSGEMAHFFENKVFDLGPTERSLMETLLEEGSGLYATKVGMYYDYSRWSTHPIAAAQLICRLELLFLKLLAASEDPDRLHRPTPEPPSLYNRIVQVLEAHITDEISINDLAEQCGVSPTTAKNCFAKYTGMGIHKYFLHLKLRAAISLLKEGASVSEVSDRLGFNNPNYFTYVFRRETGKRPSDYKR